jgi:lysozyme
MADIMKAASDNGNQSVVDNNFIKYQDNISQMASGINKSVDIQTQNIEPIRNKVTKDDLIKFDPSSPAKDITINKDDLNSFKNNVNMILVKQNASEMIKKHEGLKLEPYQDTKGFWTIGYGHLITKDKELPKEWQHKKITEDQANKMFDQDFAKAYAGAEKHPAFKLLDPKGQAALIDLGHNMGTNWFEKWKTTTSLMVTGQMDKVVHSLSVSDYAKDVGKNRLNEITGLLKNSFTGKTDKNTPNVLSEDDAKKKVNDFIEKHKDNPKLISSMAEKIQNPDLKSMVLSSLSPKDKPKDTKIIDM